MQKIYTLKSGKEVKVTASHRRMSQAWGQTHYAYTIVMAAGEDRYRFTYHDSAANYQRGLTFHEGVLDGAVYCALMDASSTEEYPTKEEFLRAYGYDWSNMKEGLQAYWACREATARINEMMTREEQEELLGIADC